MEKDDEKRIIETVDENGNVVNFELFDVVEYKEKEYALLLPPGTDFDDEDAEIVLMRLIIDGEDYVFEAIEDDEEFEEVSEYIENMDIDE